MSSRSEEEYELLGIEKELSNRKDELLIRHGRERSFLKNHKKIERVCEGFGEIIVVNRRRKKRHCGSTRITNVNVK